MTQTITGIINEEWRAVSGYANYQVSNIGRVRNVKTERILKPFVSEAGYYRASIYKNGEKNSPLIHRLVAQEFLEKPDSKLNIDHIDHNTSNNCINNLRYATSSQNHANRTKKLNASSKFKGVCFRKRIDKWEASIKVNGRTMYLGSYASEKQAAAKYNEQALAHFGEYAFLNEITTHTSSLD